MADKSTTNVGAGRMATIAGAVIVTAASMAWFARRPGEAPYFADESSYMAQSFYAGLVWDARGRHDPAWVALPAIDQPPLQKYLIGLSLRIHGMPDPCGLAGAMNWHREFNFGDGRPPTANPHAPPPNLLFGTKKSFRAGCWPAIILGAAGCAAMYGLGVLLRGPVTGLIAVGLLAANPLYGMEARQPLGDVPCASLGLLAALAGLIAWQRILRRDGPRTGWASNLALALLAGGLTGLAVLAKLTGLFLLPGFGLVVLLGLMGVRGGSAARGQRTALVGAAALALAAAIGTFVLLNPTLTAHPPRPMPTDLPGYAAKPPLGRFVTMLDWRRNISARQQEAFPTYAVRSIPERLAVFVVQGFGRFSPMGPTLNNAAIRFDPAQDWGLALWLPTVAAGVAWAVVRGRRSWLSGEPPTAWAVLALWAAASATIVAYLPLAWDRYLLPVQPFHALFAAVALTSLADGIRGRWTAHAETSPD
jgi:4-amino-4-deoxy-L-arabinose transferase-like glycosyltransferase